MGVLGGAQPWSRLVLWQSQMQPAPVLHALLSRQIRGARSVAPLLPWHSLPAGDPHSRPLCVHHAAADGPVSGAYTGDKSRMSRLSEILKIINGQACLLPLSFVWSRLSITSAVDLKLVCRRWHARCGAATRACHSSCSQRRATCSRAPWRQCASSGSCTSCRTSPSPTSTCPGLYSAVQQGHYKSMKLRPKFAACVA
jgi:hypothetical protein